MEFDEAKVKEALSAGWRWILPPIDVVIAVNSMGNVMLRDFKQCHWRVCPEELSAEVFARTPDELQAAFADPDRKADWKMRALVLELVAQFGEPEVGECFGIVIPAVLGGKYSTSNFRRRDLYEYLRFTGELADQTKDLKDGDTVRFRVI
ncbi:MAG: DUF1851 domain-containing protein [Verrucomicrobiales bacterium]